MASETAPSPKQTDSTLTEASPASQDATGDITSDAPGLSTHTQVGDDGRVEIRVDETDPALTAQIGHVQQVLEQNPPSYPSPPQYTSSASHEAPPILNIVIHVVGSRGDVQPFVALGQELKNRYSHRVRLATHGTFKRFVQENGLEFFDIGGDPAELMAFMVKNPGLVPGMKSLRAGDVGKRRKGMAEILHGCWKSCADADEAKDDQDTASRDRPKPFIANAIIANPPSFAHIHCAEKLGIPLHLMFTMPWSPTRDFPQPIANIKSSNADGSITNEMSYTVVDMMTWQGLGDLINKFRTETLDLGPLSQAAATSMLHRLRIPYTYCWSPALIPKPKDWGAHISISGFYFLPLASNYQPDPELATFLAGGPPPVYIGFGSIVVEDPNAMTELIFEAVRKTGQRALVSKGWGGLGGEQLSKPDGVYMLGNCPHDWLFKRVSCVVHHGGAGTTAAGIALGRPTVIVPFFGDQPFWGAMVARAGAGPKPIPFKELTAQGLADAILYALEPETLNRAEALGHRIKEEKGCESGAANFHAQMDVSRLRSTILGDEGLLDLNELRLYRPYEYPVQESWTLSNINSANPVLSTLGSYASGILHMPLNMAKAWGGVVYKPYKGARADGWKGLGKGFGQGLGDLFFPRRGLFQINGKTYGTRALYQSITRKLGAGTLSFILAVHYSEGFEQASKATPEERADVLSRWEELAPQLKLKKSRTGSSTSSSRVSLTSTRNSTTETGPTGESSR